MAGSTFINDFRVPGTESQDATDVSTKHFPEVGQVSAQIVWRADEGGLRDPERQSAAAEMLDAMADQPDVVGVDEPSYSPDGEAAIAAVNYGPELGELEAKHFERLDETAEAARDAGLTVEFRGMVVDLASTPSTSTAELIGVGAALIVLVIVFGSVVAAGLPLVIAAVGILTGAAIILLTALFIDVPTSAPIIAVMLGLGAGIDYALFILSRFRTNLADGEDPVTAAGHASAVAGHAVVFAGGTVLVAILGLNFAGIPFVGTMGTAAAVTVGVMVLAAMTLLPALLGLLGPRVNALPLPRIGAGRRKAKESNPPASDASTTEGDASATEPGAKGSDGAGPAAPKPEGATYRWARHVQRYPVLYVIVSTVLLLLLTAPLFALRLGAPDDGTQADELTQRRAYDIVSEHFGPGFNAPLLVTVSNTDDATVKDLVRELEKHPDTSRVTPPQKSKSGDVSLITVIPEHAPQDQEVSDLVHDIRDSIAPRVLDGSGQVLVGGGTAVIIDMGDVIGERLPWVVLAVVGAGMLLLFGMFRAPVVALKAALMTLLSIGVAFGVVVMVFQWGWGIELLGLDKTVPIMSAVPMLLFAVLYGLSMDYEVFLLSAVREAYDKDRDPHEAVVTGIGTTARVITAAAVIMACVFLGFTPLPDTIVQMLGVGLATAVIIDATVIRMVLVPALMTLLGHWSWWTPASRGRDKAVDGGHDTAKGDAGERSART
ncbi:MMPL family transporter [Streptomyces sp. NPDC047315]|uniref:MMPL family transporter n=1 Tax=Streptomyces sp. NPDC047315 TaxID=3155142 RepID=UPI0033C2876C